MLRRITLTGIPLLVFALMATTDAPQAEAQIYGSYRSPMYHYRTPTYSYRSPSYHYRTPIYRSYRSYHLQHPRRPHYDYFPSQIVPHGNHYHYVPGHYHLHHGNHYH